MPATAAPAATLTYEPQSTMDVDDAPYEKAVATCRLVAHVDGQAVGYVKASYMTDELTDRLLPTIWHFMGAHRGWCIDPDDPADLWRGAHRYARRSPASRPDLRPSALTVGNTPNRDTIDADLAVLAQRVVGERDRTVDALRIPFVAYASVDRGWRRQGLATAMYMQLARHLADDGKVLRASNLRSPEAQALWSNLRCDPDVRLTTVDTPDLDGTIRTLPALDARR